MSMRPPRPEGSPWLSPYLVVKDPDAAIDFYERAFGFAKRMSMPGPDGRTAHVELAWQDAMIMLGPESDQTPARAPVTSGIQSPVGLYLYCEDVDALFARATKTGCKAVASPKTEFWGDRRCRVADPDGYIWDFATNVADFDPANMPK
jgi:PhnB protein